SSLAASSAATACRLMKSGRLSASWLTSVRAIPATRRTASCLMFLPSPSELAISTSCSAVYGSGDSFIGPPSTRRPAPSRNSSPMHPSVCGVSRARRRRFVLPVQEFRHLRHHLGGGSGRLRRGVGGRDPRSGIIVPFGVATEVGFIVLVGIV